LRFNACAGGKSLLSLRPCLLRRGQRPDREVVEFFPRAEAAEAMIDEVRDDEPTLAENLRVETLEFR
jgi:hypothetical protein